VSALRFVGVIGDAPLEVLGYACAMNRHLLLGALLCASAATRPVLAETPPASRAVAESPTNPAPRLSPLQATAVEPPVRYRLENGLEVSLQRDPRQPRVAIAVAYHVGSADDPEGYRGLAHLTEHMMFEGSSSRPGSDYFQHIEAAGTTAVNGMTSRDETLYLDELPRAQLTLGLWHEASRMAYLLKWLDAQDLSRARAAVLNEADLRKGPGSRISTIIAQHLYPREHPYHRAEEEESDIEAITLSDVRWFFQQWYGPANASLAVVGDFDVETARRTIDTMFAPIVQRGKSAQPLRPKLSRLSARVELDIAWPIKRGNCTMVWLVPPDADEDDRALDVLARHLSFELEGLVTRHGSLSRASAVYAESQRSGEMTLEWSTDEETDGEAEREAIEALLRDARTKPLTPAQLVRARESLRETYLFARESLTSRSLALASSQDRASSWDYDVLATRMAAVTSAQVLSAAQRFMAQERSLDACASYRRNASKTKLRRSRVTPIPGEKP